MATYTKGTGQAGTLRLIVSYSQDKTNNRTTFTGRYELSSAWSATYANGASWSSSSAGQSDSGTYSISGVSTVTLDSFTRTINHASDGSLSNQTFSITIGATGTSGLGGPTTLSKSISVPDIPRASTPSFDSPWPVIENPVESSNTLRVYTESNSSSFRFDFDYTFGDASGEITNNAINYNDWSVPRSLLNEIPNTTTGVGTVYSKTKTSSSGSVIGTKSRNFRIYAGDTIIPSFSSKSHSEANALVASEVGAYVQGLSKLNLAIGGASGIYSSTITGYSYKVGGNTTSVSGSSGVMSNPILSAGSVVVEYEVTDSRGRKYKETETISVLPYDAPGIETISVQRCLSDGTVDSENGTYIRVNLNAQVQSLVNGTQKNALTFKIETRPTGGAWTNKGTWAAGDITYDDYEVVGTYPISSSYEVRVTVFDKFQNVVASRNISTGKVPFDMSDVGVGVGKVHQYGVLDVKGESYLEGRVFITGGVSSTGILVTNWNDAMLPGKYKAAGSAANAPTSINMVGEVYMDVAGNLIQELRIASGSGSNSLLGGRWIRMYSFGASSWSFWRQANPYAGEVTCAGTAGANYRDINTSYPSQYFVNTPVVIIGTAIGNSETGAMIITELRTHNSGAFNTRFGNSNGGGFNGTYTVGFIAQEPF